MCVRVERGAMGAYLLLLLAHLAVVELLPHQHLAIALPPDFVHFSERTCANRLQLIV